MLRRIIFWLCLPIIAVQGLWVRRSAPRFAPAEGARSGRTGNDDEALRVLFLGDSIFDGVGTDTVAKSLPGLIIARLEKALRRPIDWQIVGQSGASSKALLHKLLPTIQPEAFNLIFVNTGVNDVTGMLRTKAWRRNLIAIETRLRNHSPGAQIIFLGLPPLHGFPLLPQPLRAIFGMRARTFDKILAELCADSKNTHWLATQFEPKPELFAADGYHPSSASCEVWADELTRIFRNMGLLARLGAATENQ